MCVDLLQNASGITMCVTITLFRAIKVFRWTDSIYGIFLTFSLNVRNTVMALNNVMTRILGLLLIVTLRQNLWQERLMETSIPVQKKCKTTITYEMMMQ